MNSMMCLVSRQAMPNVLPVLMYKPDRVYMLMTDQEKLCGLHLKELFESKKIEVITKEEIQAYNPRTVTDTLLEIKRLSGKDNLSLNLTGGTKVMSISAYEFAKTNNIPAFYCNTENQKIIELLPQVSYQNLSVQLSIEDYLLSYGYRIKEKKSVAEIEKYYPLFEFIETNNLMRSFIKFSEDVKTKLAQSNPKFSVSSADKNFIFHKTINSLRLEFGKAPRKSFNVDASQFKSGDWLEHYIYYKLKDEKDIEILSGVKIFSDKGVDNEIDVIVLKDFILYLISCKSGKKDNQYDLFQLEVIRNISSGTFGKGIFVTVNKTTDMFIERADQLNIKVIRIEKDKIGL